MRNSQTVANRFLALAEEREDALTPMQLLKLVYIAHGWMLGIYGRPLIKDRVEAWQYGPVIPALYKQLREYRGAPVTKSLPEPFGAKGLDEAEDDVVRQVYDAYGSRTGMSLSRLTHSKGSPWDMVYQPGTFGEVIPTDLIEDHYRRLAERGGQEVVA
ncbi:MAG TPA: type II toxin-antitoxin system antitoxin SocA domain-containing protein [Allosphingosinicella sp.]